jgi:predicted RNA binding protein YcfA (HicA-like mRNA interferase family)
VVDGYHKVVCAELKKLGFVFSKGAKGSHEKWTHPETGKTVIVPHNLYSRHTANGILKDAGGARRF